MNVKVSGNGIGLSGAIFLVFLTLKLTGTIDWSWWWVTSPIWIGWAIFLIALLLFGIVYGVLTLLIRVETKRNRRRKAKQLKSFRRPL